MSQRIRQKIGPQAKRDGSPGAVSGPALQAGSDMETKRAPGAKTAHSGSNPAGRKLRSQKGETRTKSLGPVPDLEAHVESDWWQKIFNSLYLKTDADVLEDPEISALEVKLFTEILDLSPEEKVLDLCCGQGRHALELARRGFSHVEGYDNSAFLIRKARARADKAGLSISFRQGDARALPYEPASFDAVTLLGNSFGYFDSESQDLQLLKEICRVLKPGGRLLVDVADGEFLKTSFQPRSWEWVDDKHFVCRERSLSADGTRLISREVISHVKKGVVADQFYAERLYSEKSLVALLRAAGFKEPAFHGDYSPESRKNQDLGMMGRRILVSALVEKTMPLPSTPEIVKNVVVLMGDPRREDIVRPASVFDEDDFETIARLKTALAEVPGLNFTYLDCHETLIEDLKNPTGKIDLVLNLCDEGFENDPLKELHVPALLDQLKIPYTGAGPRCLAFCYDKSLVRGVAREMGIPVARALFINPGDCLEGPAPYPPFGFPVIVKPNSGDSSFGITQKSVAHSPEELASALSSLRERVGPEGSLLVEEFLPGKDVSVGLIGNSSSCTVLPITEEDYSEVPETFPRLCGYEAKWLPDSPYWKIRSVPAGLPRETEKEIIKHSLALFSRLECRDYARFDWRLDSEGRPRLLEANPNPGWCWDGHLAKMAAYDGMSYSDMLKAILDAAEKRLWPETFAGVSEITKETVEFQPLSGNTGERARVT
ncbi:MAG: methyltransferase domain-containing protein [Methanosarcinaceae archaeon]|nr:methyltransferase domain-containing protein [Methanosarcinaceae archaeon]